MAVTGSSPCPYCEGAGCDECDNTGRRHTTYITDLEVDLRVHGSKPLTPEGIEALQQIARLVFDRMRGEG